MHLRKAVITAAAPNQNTLPLQRLVDRNGIEKTALQLIVEEVTAAGIEEICVVIQPGDARAYEIAAGEQLGSLTFVEQPVPRGYGHALCQAKPWVAGEPFIHLVGDHLYVSAIGTACALQLVQAANEHGCAVSAVQATREHRLADFGVIGGIPVPRSAGLYEVQRVLEKPTPTAAEQDLLTPGLRSGHYLCFFGMHVLTPIVLDLLEASIKAAPPTHRVTLSDALTELAQRERYLALQVKGARHNIGAKYGLLMAQLALGLSGRDRDQLLTELVELLANRVSGNGA